MNHTATEIRDGKDLLGQPVHFPVNAEKLLSAVRFSRTLSSLKQLWWKKASTSVHSKPTVSDRGLLFGQVWCEGSRPAIELNAEKMLCSQEHKATGCHPWLCAKGYPDPAEICFPQGRERMEKAGKRGGDKPQ